jgi:hypothetical protein
MYYPSITARHFSCVSAIHTLPSYYFRDLFNIILPSMPRSSKRSLYYILRVLQPETMYLFAVYRRAHTTSVHDQLPAAKPCPIFMTFGTGVHYKMRSDKRHFRVNRHTEINAGRHQAPTFYTQCHPNRSRNTERMGTRA